jgi:hypothetical protein
MVIEKKHLSIQGLYNKLERSYRALVCGFVFTPRVCSQKTRTAPWAVARLLLRSTIAASHNFNNCNLKLVGNDINKTDRPKQ